MVGFLFPARVSEKIVIDFRKWFPGAKRRTVRKDAKILHGGEREAWVGVDGMRILAADFLPVGER